MHPFNRLAEKKQRIVAGIMSGTSLDGVDVALVRLEGSGRGLRLEHLGFVSRPFREDLRSALLRNSSPESSSVLELSQLNFRLAHTYAEALKAAAEAAGVDLTALDLIGSHGQTVHHVPTPADCAGSPVASTLQIGDPSVLANLTGIPVVGDFRAADMALGGQGAPLVPYFDWVCFGSDREARGLLNIGGIGNITVLPRGARVEKVYAFDTGPGNMVIDAMTTRHFGRPYDEDGRIASEGQVLEGVVADLLMDDYFLQPPPKSTGRERFGAPFVDRLSAMLEHREPRDRIATAAALTVFSVYQAYARFIRERDALDVLIVGGGGVRNRFLMDRLASTFAPIPVRSTAEYGIDPDAKEAVCFAVLAHETINGTATNVPSVTGARRSTLLGKICLPL